VRGRTSADDRPAAFEPLEPRLLLTGDVLIGQFMAINDSTIADVDNEYSDWIQLHNVSDAAIELGGWFLTDDAAELDKWAFPAETLGADGYLVVFASGKDRAVAGEQLHTNFKLAGDGEYLGLIRPDASTVEHEYAPRYPPQEPDIPYGVEVGTDIISLVAPGDPAHVWIPPSDVLGRTWTEASFVPAGWVAGANGVGYDAAVTWNPGATTTLLTVGAPARALVPTGPSLGSQWTQIEFDDSLWLAGTTGVGYAADGTYDSFIGLDLGSSMPGVNTSAYIRIPFTVADPAQVMALWLQVKCDDGFAAWINGVEVASYSAPRPPLWNSAATSYRSPAPTCCASRA